MRGKKLFDWAGKSLIGHVVLFELSFSTILFVTLAGSNYQQGTLTLEWGLLIALVCVVSGALVAGFYWYTVTLPLLKKSE